ncbi:hypothetical protein CEUSTIGMA_g7896.t1 [Chlamydomonas eustigma]|uniref:DUF7642 domain-containing protein n=1 Tax=Chlamydomonas eustigma TaxID=1157962 RepID=A0A250XBK2_9CHLO|nr:hypothetical protein CEUSTIGMA_g7896.t1 [Chlamydomonas eustigma]|eukprot:GAX80457.1 hypothetical protein CEUSTIGMA_g7896.t1 [Chlamydomonas eustigma]
MMISGYNALADDHSSLEEIQRFLDTEELLKPLNFEKTPKFSSYITCLSWIGALASTGLTCCCPLILFTPEHVTKHYALKLDADALVFHSAYNDCCCHVAVSQQTLPLDKIQDVQLQEGCLQTCFGLKDVRVQTAGMNQAGTPDVSTAFLAYPEKAREAIQLAIKLSKKRMLTVPQQENSVLTASEATSMRVKVLAADQDLTLRLSDAERLHSQGLLTKEDFDDLRVAIIAQL